jgi:hypothetical protein
MAGVSQLPGLSVTPAARASVAPVRRPQLQRDSSDCLPRGETQSSPAMRQPSVDVTSRRFLDV